MLDILLVLTFSNISCYSRHSNCITTLWKDKQELKTSQIMWKMSHRASETTEANYPAPQPKYIDLFRQQEDIKHLLFTFFVIEGRCVCQSLSFSFSRHPMLWFHAENNQGPGKLKLHQSCSLWC